MEVTFAFFGEDIASSRLRAKIPQIELQRWGIGLGRDVVVYGKHVLTHDHLKPFRKRVFDICDDHFGNQFRGYYIEHCRTADAVTCNSEEMSAIIRRETGRQATVIPDPYEAPEKDAGAGEGYLWFGHPCNQLDIEPYSEVRVYTLPDWTLEGQRQAISECAAVVLPVGEKLAKSANRLLESVRCGRFVIAGALPSYLEFSPWMYIGDIKEGMSWFERNRDEAIKRVSNCQDYIRERFSPKTIASQWKQVLERVCR